MTDRSEWEVVDEPSPHARDQGQGPRQGPGQGPTRMTPQQLLQALLGPKWRWKLAGFITLAGVLLALLAAFVGIAMLVISASALVLIAVTKVRQWLLRAQRANLPTRHKP